MKGGACEPQPMGCGARRQPRLPRRGRGRRRRPAQSARPGAGAGLQDAPGTRGWGAALPPPGSFGAGLGPRPDVIDML